MNPAWNELMEDASPRIIENLHYYPNTNIKALPCHLLNETFHSGVMEENTNGEK